MIRARGNVIKRWRKSTSKPLSFDSFVLPLPGPVQVFSQAAAAVTQILEVGSVDERFHLKKQLKFSF